VESPISTRAAILQILSVEPSYGSAIMEKVVEITESRFVIQSGSLYPALMSMEKDGLIVKKRKIVSKSGDADAGRACFYELTRKGRQLAREHRLIALRVFFPWQAGKEKEKRWLDGFSSISMAS